MLKPFLDLFAAKSAAQLKKTMNNEIENLIKTLKDKTTAHLIECKVPLESYWRYLNLCECVLHNGKLYFPNFHDPYENSDKEGEIQSYSHPTNTSLVKYLKEIELPRPLAAKDDCVLCACLCSNFSFYYGDYELIVVCNNCGNEWSAYSG